MSYYISIIKVSSRYMRGIIRGNKFDKNLCYIIINIEKITKYSILTEP